MLSKIHCFVYLTVVHPLLTAVLPFLKSSLVVRWLMYLGTLPRIVSVPDPNQPQRGSLPVCDPHWGWFESGDETSPRVLLVG